MSEAKRLRKIEELEIAGASGAGTFFSLVEMAASLCATQAAAITVIDKNTRWFYSSVGLSVRSTPRQGACCERVLETCDLVAIEDLHELRDDGIDLEPFFKDWSFYAGAPIMTARDEVIGTIFIADEEPRIISDSERNTLITLANLAVESIRLHESLLAQQRASLEIYEQTDKLERSNAALEKTQLSMELAARVAKIGFWSRDLVTNKFAISDSLQTIFDTDIGPMITEDEFSAQFMDSARQNFLERLNGAAEKGEPIDMHLPLKHSDENSARWVRVTGRPSRAGAARQLNGCVQDVTELFESRSKISKIAMLDTLTGAYNRRFLPLTYLKKKRFIDPSQEQLIALTIDLDNFKFVNDTAGHEAGDQVLVEVARLLRAQIRDDDILARLGGDEFLVLAAVRVGSNGAEALAEKLRCAAIDNRRLSQFANPVTFSIGYCDATDKEADFPTALRRSDLAVFEAKKRGRNCAVQFTRELSDESSRRSSTLLGIDEALAANEIVPFYQPKIALDDETVVGLEALARWRKSDGTILPPAHFIDALEDPVYSTRISERIMVRALADAQMLVDKGLEFGRIACNVAEAQMRDARFPEWLQEQARARNIRMSQIEIEITERCLLSRSKQKVQENISNLREMGVTISFDDFGTGFASLAHLLNHRIDIIKIDCSFIQNLLDDRAAKAIAGSIVHLGRGLDMEVVAEGVECENTVRALREMGCATAQGYHYSRPIPVEQLMDFLNERQPRAIAKLTA
ncbi:MAG: EAL domain-containing protein [Neomegalonema sp.]|nr:EAL domain-containing protein [Neomegalonema sp.]